MTFAQLLHDWHDFYVLLGTASATLVGLMFLAATIGATVFSEANRGASDPAARRPAQRVGHDDLDHDEDAGRSAAAGIVKRLHCGYC